MDITPQLIRETTFHESLRGYNKEEVEDYKQRWAEGVLASDVLIVLKVP